jgi:hypothetical protein
VTKAYLHIRLKQTIGFRNYNNKYLNKHKSKLKNWIESIVILKEKSIRIKKIVAACSLKQIIALKETKVY